MLTLGGTPRPRGGEKEIYVHFIEVCRKQGGVLRRRCQLWVSRFVIIDIFNELYLLGIISAASAVNLWCC